MSYVYTSNPGAHEKKLQTMLFLFFFSWLLLKSDWPYTDHCKNFNQMILVSSPAETKMI